MRRAVTPRRHPINADLEIDLLNVTVYGELYALSLNGLDVPRATRLVVQLRRLATLIEFQTLLHSQEPRLRGPFRHRKGTHRKKEANGKR